ncbi:MAG: HAD-IIIA family hydrolase [Planctomycetota bacterium]
MIDAYVSPYSPLPRTVHAPRGLFVDRWGTLLAPPPAGFARDPGEVEFYPGAREALRAARRAGWLVYLLGNEEAVARGEVAEADWERVEAAIRDGLSQAGVEVQRLYACLDHPAGVPGRTSDSVYLLPNTGAFYHAFHNDGTELRRSWAIGDSTLELVAGWRAGCKIAAVETGLALSDRTFHIEPEIQAATLADVLARLLAVEAPIYRRVG